MDVRDARGRTPLQDVIGRENVRVMEVLINEARAAVWTRDELGSTLLHEVVRSCSASFDPSGILRYQSAPLASGGGGLDVDDRDRTGMSPLMLAVSLERYVAARVLLEQGADPNRTCLILSRDRFTGPSLDTPLSHYVRELGRSSVLAADRVFKTEAGGYALSTSNEDARLDGWPLEVPFDRRLLGLLLRCSDLDSSDDDATASTTSRRPSRQAAGAELAAGSFNRGPFKKSWSSTWSGERRRPPPRRARHCCGT